MWITVALCFCLTQISPSTSENRRLVLHSQDDVYNVLTALTSKVNSLESELAASKTRITKLETELTATKNTGTFGATYIRWGRTTCPNNGTEFIYNGYMAGGKWDEAGGGPNHLCLPQDPTWNKYVDGINSNVATIYGTEIEVEPSLSNAIFGKQVIEQDVPCAVCRTTRASHVMIPARASCYNGWTKEYGGYLISSHPGWKNNADYVCLDAELEFVQHGAANDNEHVVLLVEMRCGTYGSLPCPPFHNGRELACVVCTK